MPPVVFDYGDTKAFPNEGFAENFDQVVPTRNSCGYPGDYNGDGVGDLLVTGDGGENSWEGWRLFIANREYYEQTHGQTWHEAAINGSEPSGDSLLFPADFDGDAKTDILAVHYPSGTSKLYLSTGTGLEASFDGPGFDLHGPRTVNYFLGDFNGDGRMDILMDRDHKSGSEYEIYYYTDNGFESHNYAGIHDHHRLNPGDFNGDGMTDFLMRQDRSEKDDATIKWASDMGIENCSINNMLDISYKERLVTRDFNGDGRTDILATWNAADYPEADYDGYRLLFANGESFVQVEQGDAFGWRDKLVTGDFNGDGKTDLVVMDDPDTDDPDIEDEQRGYDLYNATGNGFEKVAGVGWDTRLNGRRRQFIADYNGDGLQDVLSGGDNQTGSTNMHWAQVNEDSPSIGLRKHLLGKITNPMGAETLIEYTPSSAWTNTFLPMTMQTVSRVTIQDNMAQGAANATTYTYGGGAYNPVAREFRGFGQIIAIDQSTGVTTETLFHQDDRFEGRIKENKTFSRNGRLMITTANTWEAFDYGSGRTFAFVRHSEVSRYDDVAINHEPELARIATDYDYDNFGNLLSEDKTVVNLKTNEEIRRFTRTQYINDETAWILGKPANIRIDAVDPGEPGAPALRETRMTYDPARPWLLAGTTLVRWDEDNNEILSTTTYAYDAYGNTIRVSDPRNPDWAVTTSYDESDGVFPNQTTNALGQRVHRVFDPRFGAVLSETGPNNQTTNTDYDEFGRITHEAFADGSSKNYTTYAYDDRDRIRKQTNPDNTHRTIDYEGFNEIITDEQGHVKRVTRDALGRLVQVVEPTKGHHPICL